MSERLDVVGIGNAMVDAIIPSSRAEVEKHQINRDSMNLINEELKNKLHKDYSIKEMIGGDRLVTQCLVLFLLEVMEVLLEK